MPFPLRTRTRGRPSRNAGVVNVVAAPSFNPLTDWTTDPVHGVWASDPLWTPPADAGAVSSWRNGGSVGGDLVQATGSKQPTYRAATAAFNNKPTIQFDGTDDVLHLDVTDIWQTWSIVGVAQATSTAATRVFFNGGDVAPRGSVGVRDPGGTWTADGGVAANYGTSDTTTHLHTVVGNGASSKTFVDGTVGFAGDLGANPITHLTVGAYSSTPVAAWVGHIALVLVFAGDVTTQPEWATFKAWVTSTYGITVA